METDPGEEHDKGKCESNTDYAVGGPGSGPDGSGRVSGGSRRDGAP